MIWILTTIMILSRRHQQRIDALAVRIQRVAPFYDAVQFASSEELTFMSGFLRAFLMQ